MNVFSFKNKTHKCSKPLRFKSTADHFVMWTTSIKHVRSIATFPLVKLDNNTSYSIRWTCYSCASPFMHRLILRPTWAVLTGNCLTVLFTVKSNERDYELFTQLVRCFDGSLDLRCDCRYVSSRAGGSIYCLDLFIISWQSVCRQLVKILECLELTSSMSLFL